MIAWTNPAMSWSWASAATCRPRSWAVLVVMGPMEAKAALVLMALRRSGPRISLKLRAVEELVKVTRSGA